MRELHQKAFVLATSAALLISIFLLIFGNYIFSLWTREKVEFSFSLMLAFLITLIFRNIWSTSGVALMATNKHSKMGLMYVLFSTVSIFVAIVLTKYFPSILLNVYCLLIIEISLCLYTVKTALVLTDDTFGNLFSSYKGIFISYKELFKGKLTKTI
jgi:hypothetical protein